MAGYSIDLRWWLLSNLAGIESLQTLYAIFVIITFIGFLILSLYPLVPRENQATRIQTILLSNSLFVVSLIAFILAARWPGFLAALLNIDEAQFTAAAMKLLRDPVFWRSVDGGSTGPLNVYPLALPAFLGIRVEYASSRVVGLIFIITAITCLYHALSCLYSKAISRLATIPVVTTVALMTAPDYVHYSSEHLSIALLSGALLLICKYVKCNSGNPNRLTFSLGFVLGLIPYAKMQAVPIAASIACIFFHLLYLKSKTIGQFCKNVYPFLLGGVLFSLLIFMYLAFFSIFDVFWKSYIQHSLLFYSKNSVPGDKNLFGVGQFSAFANLILIGTKDTRFLFLLTEIILIAGIPLLIIKRVFSTQNRLNSDTFFFIYYSLVLLVASIYSIVKPGNIFLHYLLFLIIPSGFLIGVYLGEIEKVFQSQKVSSQNLKLSLLAIAVGIIADNSFFQVVTALSNKNFYIAQRQLFTASYITPDAKTIARHASSGDSMAVWGWAPELYVGTNLVQATRDSTTGGQIISSPLQKYFIKRYVDDLTKSNARLFVDAVAPGMFFFQDREKYGHQKFPEIANIIRQNYHLVDESEGIRIYSINP